MCSRGALIVIHTGTVIHMKVGCAQAAGGAVATFLAVGDGGTGSTSGSISPKACVAGAGVASAVRDVAATSISVAIVSSTFTRALIVIDTGTVIHMKAGCAQAARGAVATFLAVGDGGSAGGADTCI